MTREIFANASPFIKKPTRLILRDGDRQADWYNARKEGMGDLRAEGLLEKNANEKKSGAGAVFHAASSWT
ncbi:MAG: hypothetical protein IPP55_11580 [Anaerolineales bacterium]|nr:hypothetical protein [Anaerolineales bacterium]